LKDPEPIYDAREAGLAMIPDIDIWRCANMMMKRYGRDAALEAAHEPTP